jgi:hypothetical protein
LRTTRSPSGAAAQEDVAAQPVARHQPRPGLAHRVQPFEPQLEPQRQFLGARRFLGDCAAAAAPI